jgi:hypothetical protein
VIKVVNRYIGVSDGYLGDFSYRTHAEFYPECCDLDIDPNEIDGTTRERFIHILANADPGTQSKILRGVIERFPVEAEDAPATRTHELRNELAELAARLSGAADIPSPDVAIDANAVRQALDDAEILIAASGPASAVDRVHTALHGYLRAVCLGAGIEADGDATATRLFKLLREQHPALAASGPRTSEIEKILLAFASVLDALGTLRNRASAAHPSERLAAPEAMVAVHAARTMLHYVDARLRQDEERAK